MTQKILDEGVIKFKFTLKKTAAFSQETYLDLEKWRAIMFKMNFIGEYPIEKVGFGNLSKRIITKQNTQFIITGTQTGRFAHLDQSHYTKVIKCDLQKQFVEALGPIAPSSESLTHYALYKHFPQINYIFHIHSKEFWKFMLENNYPKTPKNVPYGTIAMANAAQDCIKTNTQGIFAMEGHEDGIIAYGENAEQAGRIILDTYKELKKSNPDI